MENEKYCFDIGEDGQQGLDIIDHLFNATTQTFICNSGIRPGMNILDIGCGLGEMTTWLAQQVSPNGSVTAIDNNEFQIKATVKRLQKNGISNVKTVCLSAYDIATLNDNFDLVYCRFILHHLNNPIDVIQSIYKILNPGGIFVVEEGLVNQAFSYPLTEIWGNERWHNNPKNHDTEGVTRDGNFGMKLYHVMHNSGFKNLYVNLIQPVITSQELKDLFIKCMFDTSNEVKSTFLKQNHTEEEWHKYCDSIKKIKNDPSQLIAFYQSCQVAGVK